MKIKINRNNFWTNHFAGQLSLLGVKNVCISPGSRSTPLTLAFAAKKSLNKYIHIDERSSAFFAMGLAKATGLPSVVICTSGTAAVELYPAIVEAYQQKIPLIICTADRPPSQKGRGANQTINQDNLYKNHILHFIDAGLPHASIEGKEKICSIAREAFLISMHQSGPVHINFPFEKPFEPDSFTDEIDNELISPIPEKMTQENDKADIPGEWLNELKDIRDKHKKILIIAGPGNYNLDFIKHCRNFAELTGSPVLADVLSHLRSGSKGKGNVITLYDAMLGNKIFKKKINPDLIIQFGRTPTSKVLLEFLAATNCRRILINKFGELFDPSGKADAVYRIEPSEFCRKAVEGIDHFNVDRDWLSLFNNFEKELSTVREKLLAAASLKNEPKVISEVINNVPSGTGIMISNSSPVRDLDFFTPMLKKKVTFYYNRGASGIDGIVSTALGVTAGLKKSTVLITGDLAFLYDLTSLNAGKQYNLPLVIILLNNNGGGIFNNLPVAKYKNIFQKYFITPHNLKFGPLVKSFGWNYKLIRSEKELKDNLAECLLNGAPAVLDIITSAEESASLKKKLRSEAEKSNDVMYHNRKLIRSDDY